MYIQYGFLYLILTGPKFAMQTRWISDNLSTPSCSICSRPYQTRWISSSLSPPPAASVAVHTKLAALLQDLTQDSAALTGWRRTKRSGEGKMIAIYGPGISLLRYLNFPAFFEIPEFFGDLHDHQSEELLSYASILHSSMPEDNSGIFRRVPCEKMRECAG